MNTIDLLKKNVRGVERSFLVKDGEIVECDMEKEKLHFLSRNILFLVESFLKASKDLKRLSIFAEGYCIIFFYDVYALGIVAAKDTNFPLLDMVSNKLLYTIEEHPEEPHEAVDEVLQRMDTFIG